MMSVNDRSNVLVSWFSLFHHTIHSNLQTSSMLEREIDDEKKLDKTQSTCHSDCINDK